MNRREFLAPVRKLASTMRASVNIMRILTITAFLLALGHQSVSLGADTRAGTVVRTSGGAQPYWVEQLADGLNFPSSMAWLPNGDMLITERMGGLRLWRNGALDPQPIGGMPASFQNGVADGLKDILVDPDYADNQTLFILISEGTVAERHTAVYRARLTSSGLEGLQRIFRSKDSIGGYIRTIASRMTFLPDKTLLIAVPEDDAAHALQDATIDNNERAQDLGSHLGKVLRINRDGSVPRDNPFLSTPGVLPEIYSYGHRIPLGFYWEPHNGSIMEVESGPRGGDELNILKPGVNYGWGKAGWGFSYTNNGAKFPQQSGTSIQDPLLIWTPSVTPSGITCYRGKAYPQWDGDYFVGHLTTKEIERVRFEGQRVVLQEKMLFDLEERIRDVKVGPDDRLYLLTDHQNGRVLRLQPGQPRAHQLERVARKLELVYSVPLKPGDPVRGRQAFLERCAGCHTIGAEIKGGQIGPDLSGVFGAVAGRKPGFDYSPNMAASAHKWDAASLDRFLFDPNALIPATRMAAPPLIDMELRRNIIEFLKQQSAEPSRSEK